MKARKITPLITLGVMSMVFFLASDWVSAAQEGKPTICPTAPLAVKRIPVLAGSMALGLSQPSRLISGSVFSICRVIIPSMPATSHNRKKR